LKLVKLVGKWEVGSGKWEVGSGARGARGALI